MNNCLLRSYYLYKWAYLGSVHAFDLKAYKTQNPTSFERRKSGCDTLAEFIEKTLKKLIKVVLQNETREIHKTTFRTLSNTAVAKVPEFLFVKKRQGRTTVDSMQGRLLHRNKEEKEKKKGLIQ